MARQPRRTGGHPARPSRAGVRAAAPTGVARRRGALMADDLGGAVPFQALAFVKAGLEADMAARSTFREIKAAVESGEMAVALAMKSVQRHPIETILERNGSRAACAAGCAFCCILAPDAAGRGNGGPITRVEAERLFAALAPLVGAPDGRDWRADACPALDPETKMCRAYESRPVLCRSTASADAAICEALADGDESRGTNARHAASYMLHVAQALGRRSMGAEAPTYALARFAAAVIDGAGLEAALKAARHSRAETEEIARDALAAFAHATRQA